MRRLPAPRLASLEVFSSCLLAVLAIPALGCSAVVINGEGNGGAEGATTSAATTHAATTPAATTAADATTQIATTGTDAATVATTNAISVTVGSTATSVPGGRPFLVDDTIRQARVVTRGDWSAPCTTPKVDMSDAIRATLAASWEEIARMEHASIAAFARFALQLLAIGAPAELVAGAQAAMADEIAHARLAFALAGAYRGEAIGPGPLDVTGALDGADDVRQIFSLLIREGCVGETVAALEAGELAETCEDASPRRVLAQIAADETRHAELAWRTVRWGLEAFGDYVRAAIAQELLVLEAELAGSEASVASRDDEALARHGIATPGYRDGLRREALARSVVPCLRAVLEAERLAA